MQSGSLFSNHRKQHLQSWLFCLHYLTIFLKNSTKKANIFPTGHTSPSRSPIDTLKVLA